MSLKKVRIQLKWVPQAQFAGIFVAMHKGYFRAEGIEVEWIAGGPGINVDKRVARGAADVGISSLHSLLYHVQQGYPIVSVAQIFQKSSKGLVTYRSSGIRTPALMKGKTIGNFGGSSELQIKVFLKKYKLNRRAKVVTQRSINQFISGKVDAGAYTQYNELQTIVEKGIRRGRLNLFDFSQEGIGMLEDTIIVRKGWLRNNRRTALGVVRAILKGWRFAFRHPEESVNIVMKYAGKGSIGTGTSRQHQAAMLRILRGIIMPKGFTAYDIGRFRWLSVKRTARILHRYGFLKSPIRLRQAIDPTLVKRIYLPYRGMEYRNNPESPWGIRCEKNNNPVVRWEVHTARAGFAG